MELVKQELYKIYSQKVIYIAFVIFAFLFSFHFFNEVRSDSDREQLREAFALYGGQLSEEKIAWAHRILEQHKQVREQDEGGDGQGTVDRVELRLQAHVAGQIVNAEQLIRQHEQSLGQWQAEAAALRDRSGRLTFEEKSALKRFEEAAAANVPDYVGYHQGWKRILQFMSEVGCLFAGALTILGLSGSYSSEYASRMDSLLFSSRHGRIRLAAAKMGAAAIYCTSVVILYNGIAFMLYGLAYGWSGGMTELVNITSIFGQTGFNGLVWQYYAVQLIYATIGCTALGLLVMFVSSLTRFPILPAFLSGFILLFPFVAMLVQIPLTAVTEPLFRLFRYLEFIQLDSLDSAFLYSNFLGIPVRYLYSVLFSMAVYIAVTAGLVVWSVSRREATDG